METAHHPAEPDGPFDGGARPEDAGPPPPLPDRVTAAYLPVAELLERVEETGPADASSGSGPGPAPRLEAVRALLDEQVIGDWPDLARLLVAPAELTRPTGPTGTLATPVLPDDPRALFYEDYRLGVPRPAEPVPEETGPEVTEPVPATSDEIVQAALDSPHACLVRAADGPERTAALAEIVRRLAADGRRTLLLTPAPQAAAGLLDALHGSGQIRTIRAEPPDDPAEPDPLGELRRLRRELLWLEQWPRDLAALDDLRAHGERRRAELAAGERRLVEAVEAAGLRIETADRLAAEARRRLERTGEEHARAVEEAGRARAAWRDLQEIADTAARDADARTRAADAAETRHRDLAQQALRCEQELQAARDREATLTDELTRARQALPEAVRETEQLAADAADATAAQHASYYRLAAAESAHAAQRRKLSWGQRLHVAPTPPEVEEARQLVKWRRREAEETAERARVAVQAHQQAEALRAGLAKFMADAENELVALAQTQERLGGQLATLTAGRDAAYTEVQRLAREAAEAVDHATQTTATARHAGQVAAEAEQRAAAARQAHDAATAEAERADAEAAEAREHRSALDAELERHRADTVTQTADLEAEMRAFTEAEARSRRHVQQICGTDTDEVPQDLLSGRRAEAMARVEELAAVLEAAHLFHATPRGFGRSPYARGAAFDVLIVLDADRIGDADLLIGAVRSHRWLLVADGEGRPPLLTEDYPEHEHLRDLDPAVREAVATRLEHSAFERCLATAPALCRDLTVPAAEQPQDATRPLADLSEDAPAEDRPAPDDPTHALNVPPADGPEEDPPPAAEPPAAALPASDDATRPVTVPESTDTSPPPTADQTVPTSLTPDAPAETPSPADLLPAETQPADTPPTAPQTPPPPANAASADDVLPAGEPGDDPPPAERPAFGDDDATRPVAVPNSAPNRDVTEPQAPVGGRANPNPGAAAPAGNVLPAGEPGDDPPPAERPAFGDDDATRPVAAPNSTPDREADEVRAFADGRAVAGPGDGAPSGGVPFGGVGEGLVETSLAPGFDDATRPVAVPGDAQGRDAGEAAGPGDEQAVAEPGDASRADDAPAVGGVGGSPLTAGRAVRGDDDATRPVDVSGEASGGEADVARASEDGRVVSEADDASRADDAPAAGGVEEGPSTADGASGEASSEADSDGVGGASGGALREGTRPGR